MAAEQPIGPPTEGDALSVGSGQKGVTRIVDAKDRQIGVDGERHERDTAALGPSYCVLGRPDCEHVCAAPFQFA